MAPLQNKTAATKAAATANVTGVAPGGTGTFAVDFLDKDGQVVQAPANIVPQWTSSDSTNAPVQAPADGLTVSVSVPAGATIASFDLTVGATLADGTALQATVTVPVTQAGVVNPVALGIRQTS